MVESERFRAAIAAIDAANAGDPASLVVDGVARPKEQAHAEMMTEWVRRLDPGASETQLLAARAHHLRRWSIRRDSYPKGRAGYLKWRSVLQRQHADDVADILRRSGYDDGAVREVQRIIRKEGLRAAPADDAVQTHEDALCIVFLATQSDDLIEDLGDDKAVDVFRKTLDKMSPAGLGAAAALNMSARTRRVLERALKSR